MAEGAQPFGLADRLGYHQATVRTVPQQNGMPLRLSWAVVWAVLALVALPVAAAPVLYGYRVVASFPHDRAAFTQGLTFHQGRLFESVGGYGRSALREVDLSTGRVVRERPLPAHLFGEGLAVAGERLLQLTWRAGVGFIHAPDDLAALGEFRYRGEGWGLASHGDRLAMSDGTAFLRWLHPATLVETGRVEVFDGTTPVAGLNELEFVHGQLFANVWPSNRIAIIDPAAGLVTGWLDLAGILPVVFRRPDTDVLNGIAHDATTDRLFVTGKRWPRLFQIELVAAAPSPVDVGEEVGQSGAP